jgi:hypothetical protein
LLLRLRGFVGTNFRGNAIWQLGTEIRPQIPPRFEELQWAFRTTPLVASTSCAGPRTADPGRGASRPSPKPLRSSRLSPQHLLGDRTPGSSRSSKPALGDAMASIGTRHGTVRGGVSSSCSPTARARAVAASGAAAQRSRKSATSLKKSGVGCCSRISDLRTAVDSLPLHARGVCPMLAAHRNGARTDFMSFARAWDPRRGPRRLPATRRQVAILEAHLEASIPPSARYRPAARSPGRSPSTRRCCATARHARRREPDAAGRARASSAAPQRPEGDRVARLLGRRDRVLP